MQDGERWLPVISWEGVYEVSSLGNVRRVKEGRGTRGPNWLLKPGAEKGGYLHITLHHDGRRKLAKIHQLVLAAFVGPNPNGAEINHVDGCTANNRCDNLEYCTSSGNKLHSYRALRRARVSCKGTANGRAKLAGSDVLEIRRRYAAGGISQQKLADDFGVSQSMVGLIVRRVSWPHLGDQ